MATPPPRSRLAVAAGATAAAWVVVMVLRLFVGGAVGLADQGDGQQLTCSLGVAPAVSLGVDERAHLWPTYRTERWTGEACGVPGSGQPYPSSERVLLEGAKALTTPLGLPGALDLRALGVLCALLVGLGVGAWVLALPGPIVHRVAVASAVGLVYADSSIAPWFISAYAEPAAMLGILFLAPGLLWLWRRERAGIGALVVVAALGFWTMAALNLAVGLLPALLLALLWSRSSRAAPAAVERSAVDRSAPWSRRVAVRAQRWRARLATFSRSRWLALAMAAVVLVGAAACLRAEPSRLRLERKYDAFFGELIPHSPNGSADIAHFGLPKGAIAASGTRLDSPGSLARTADFERWDAAVSFPKIWGVYARDPFRVVDLGTRGMHAIGAGRTNYLGNVMANDGGNFAHDDRVPVFLTLFRAFDRLLPLLAFVWLLTLGWGLMAARAADYAPTERAVGRLAVVLVVAIASEFWWALLSGATGELVKNMELTMLLTALCFPLMLALRLTARRHRVPS